MTERARAIPLATLVGVVAVLVGVRAFHRARARGDWPALPSPASLSSRDGGGATDHWIALAPPAPTPDAGDAAPPSRTLHLDVRRTGRSPFPGPTRAHLAWTSRIGAAIEAQVVPSIDERALYVAALDGSLTALDAKTGAKEWTLALGDRAYSSPSVGANGTIYVGSDARRFYAITPSAGSATIAWKLETNGEADTGSVIVGDLVVFAAGASVLAVRPGGDVAWRFDAKKKIFTAPALGDGGQIVVGSQDHHVYALTPAGALAWAVDLGADVDGAPAIADDGAIVVGTDAGEVVRLRPSGEVVSRGQVGGYVRGPLSIARGGDALAGVYGPTPRVVRVAPDGTVRGSFAIAGTGSRELGVHGGPLEDARGALYFGAQDDDVHALGPGGAWQWSYATGADVDAPVTLLSGGSLVAASDDGNVYLFAP